MITADDAKKWFDDVFLEIGEASRVVSVEPYRDMRIVKDSNGKQRFEYMPGYNGLVIKLTKHLDNEMWVKHIVDQNINAYAVIRGDMIRLDRRVENLPFTAPSPR